MEGDALETVKARRELRGSSERPAKKVKTAESRREGSGSEGKALLDAKSGRLGNTRPATSDAIATKDFALGSATEKSLDDGTSIAPDEDAEDDLDESQLPMMSGRTGDPHERTKAMFRRHGLDLGAHSTTDNEPIARLRRVERPIRVRLHYRCHEVGCDHTGVRTGVFLTVRAVSRPLLEAEVMHQMWSPSMRRVLTAALATCSGCSGDCTPGQR